MLNIQNVLNENQYVSDKINEIFNLQANDELLFKDHKSFKKALRAPKSVKERIVNNIKELDASVVLDNPYIKRIKNGSSSFKNWSFKTFTVKANHLFVIDETTVDKDLFEISPLGYFTKDIQVPAVLEGDRVWMSLVPHEFLTLQEAVDHSKGRVLTYGLGGLGYLPLMAAMKEDVTEVVVVERGQEPIDIFNTCVVPYFPEAKKIKILKMDAFDHAPTVKDGDFDVIVPDIWHDAEDGLPMYIEFLKSFASFTKTDCLYWIEETMLTYAKRIIEILLIEKEEGATDEWYELTGNPSDDLINQIYHLAKNHLDEKDILSSNRVKSILSQAK